MAAKSVDDFLNAKFLDEDDEEVSNAVSSEDDDAAESEGLNDNQSFASVDDLEGMRYYRVLLML